MKESWERFVYSGGATTIVSVLAWCAVVGAGMFALYAGFSWLAKAWAWILAHAWLSVGVLLIVAGVLALLVRKLQRMELEMEREIWTWRRNNLNQD